MTDPGARVIHTEYGPILVSEYILELWAKYGWPSDVTLREMAANYARHGLIDGGSPEWREQV